eukprot:UN04006
MIHVIFQVKELNLKRILKHMVILVEEFQGYFFLMIMMCMKHLLRKEIRWLWQIKNLLVYVMKQPCTTIFKPQTMQIIQHLTENVSHKMRITNYIKSKRTGRRQF